ICRTWAPYFGSWAAEPCQGTVRSAVDGIRYGTIAHTTSRAASVRVAALVHGRRHQGPERHGARRRLSDPLARKSRIKNWPGPLAQFVIERRTQSLLPMPSPSGTIERPFQDRQFDGNY